jgi:hypothetical protein
MEEEASGERRKSVVDRGMEWLCGDEWMQDGMECLLQRRRGVEGKGGGSG